ncbi:hypothetical protein [uncultured Pelagimonas sp.]|uniref:hypothetical protein n=1 Tax=uncultured Pelagimonas sp. TaxID=1618102 RepID=UPI00261EFBFE|nr:hypothetical protein [uncultured Pelagimonas sp.]
MQKGLFIILLLLVPLAAAAEDRLVRLYAPQGLVETGLFKHILPRFSLKTQIKVEVVADAEGADLSLGPDGRAVFQGQAQIWHLKRQREGHKSTERLAKWMFSDVGLRTITGFAPDGTALFSVPPEGEEEIEDVTLDGNAVLGLTASKTKCARCHAVDESTRLTTIGSTPSFFVLRSLSDWQERFATFYDLNPHPSFTQVADLTDPFPEDRPPPIVPVLMTIDEVSAILAYVSGLQAADLGNPLVHQ